MYVNSTKQNIKAVLTDDIDLGKFENWTPIGSGKAILPPSTDGSMITSTNF